METDGELERPQRFGSRLCVVLVGRVNFFLLMSALPDLVAKRMSLRESSVSLWIDLSVTAWSCWFTRGGKASLEPVFQCTREWSWPVRENPEGVLPLTGQRCTTRDLNPKPVILVSKPDGAGRGAAFHQLWTVTAFVPLRNHVPRSEAVVS